MIASVAPSLDARYWRMMFVDWAGDLLAPARSPEGRFHYNGQPALYVSETQNGCVIASRRYMQDTDKPRAIYPLRVQSNRIIDLRDPTATAHFGIDTTHRAAEWHAIRATGAHSPTWDISNRIRDLGFHGMLYASRSQPDLTHLTLFDWNTPTGATVTADGTGINWP